MTASSPAKTTSRPRSFTARYALGIPLAIAVGVALYYNLLPISKALTYRLLRLEEGSHLGSSIEFLVFEIPKVLLLLTGVVFAVGIIRSFFTPQKTRALLAGRREFVGNLMAGGLGVVTPFCTCSAIPMFIGFVSAGIPLGVTFSFLIAAPLVNEVALGLLLSLFGWKVALLYLSTGLSIAIFAGWILGKLKLEKWVEPWVFKAAQQSQSEEAEKLSWPDRIDQGLQATREIVLKVTPYLILGIAVGAGIHGYVPQDYLAGILGKKAWWSIPIAVMLGVPMYSNAAGIIPIIQALLGKGASLGAALAFMMSVIGLSLPEAVILRKVLQWKLILVFFGIVAAGILLTGFLFNAVL